MTSGGYLMSQKSLHSGVLANAIEKSNIIHILVSLYSLLKLQCKIVIFEPLLVHSFDRGTY